MCCYRRFLLVILTGMAALITTKSNAQLLVGPKFGAQMGWISMNNEEDREIWNSNPALGFNIGGAALMRVRERFYLHTELLYAMQRTKVTGEYDGMLDSRLTNHMLELPISFKVNFDTHIKNLKYQVFVGAGPNISYWLAGKSVLRSSELEEARMSPSEYKVAFEPMPDLDVDLSRLYVEDANRVQLGVNAVFGLMFEPQAGNTIVLDFRFDYGHSFQARKDYGFYPEVIDFSEPMRSRYLALKVGVAYLIDTKIASRNKGKSTAKPGKRH